MRSTSTGGKRIIVLGEGWEKGLLVGLGWRKRAELLEWA
jgi:hypothetical protein